MKFRDYVLILAFVYIGVLIAVVMILDARVDNLEANDSAFLELAKSDLEVDKLQHEINANNIKIQTALHNLIKAYHP